LTKKIEADILNSASLYLNSSENIFPTESTGENRYSALFDKLKREINTHKESQLAPESIRKVLRLGLHNLGSQSWGRDTLSVMILIIR
jgi:hypothetical protein